MEVAYITTRSKNGYVVKVIPMFVCYTCHEQYCLVDDDTKIGMCKCEQTWETKELHKP